jgi:SAM-dependent methyltransferase
MKKQPLHASQAKTYDSVAHEYQARLKKTRAIKKETTQILLDYLKPGEFVLDLGCAVGYDTKMLSKKCKVVGLDISQEMVKRAKRENKGNRRATIRRGDFLSISFDKKFDAIFANAFIHLFPSGTDMKALWKMRSVLRPGGVAYISTTRSERSKEGWYRKKDYHSSEKRFRKYWRKAELSQALKKTKFNIIKYFEIDDPFGNHLMNFIVRK